LRSNHYDGFFLQLYIVALIFLVLYLEKPKKKQTL